MTDVDSNDDRERFETWITGFPYELNADRFPSDPSVSAWPRAYKDITVDLAWRAWEESKLA